MEYKYFIIKEEVQKHRVLIEHISLDLMIVNTLTKRLPPKLFVGCIEINIYLTFI